jgi:anion-transporting  ArsA/GET3 family ATPase
VTARLHVLLGAGGVGKTTLAAGYALALARAGRRVGLLGIDPARRLQDALGVALADADAPVPDEGALRAAIVQPHQAIARWVAEACADPADVERLAQNPFFRALGDRLATATDVLAAARLAEWGEGDPALTDLVVDTAPGLAAIEFVRSPRQLEALVTGRLVRWLRAAARLGDRPVLGGRTGARAVLAGLATLGGTGLVAELAEFFALVRAPLERLLVRVEVTQRWLRAADTELLVVTSPRDPAAAGAAQLVAALDREQLAARAVIVNRTWPAALGAELAQVAVPAGATALLEHARALALAQAGVVGAAAALGLLVIALAARPAAALAHRAALIALGTTLWRGLVPRAPLGPDPRSSP